MLLFVSHPAPLRAPLLPFMLLLACTATAHPGDVPDTSRFIFLPGNLIFPPLAANYQEPRTGVRKEIGSSNLKLDIGTTLDLIEYSVDPEGTSRVRMGVDLFTYALTTNAEGLRLQVDAVDGFFGGHLAFRAENTNTALGLRLRLMHLSAHFVDGHLAPDKTHWRDNREPLPFTRDFGELVGAYECTGSAFSWMVYSGFSYATLVRPVEIQRFSTLHGIELHTAVFPGPVFGKPFQLFAAYHFSLVGIPSYVGTGNIEMGGKFGTWGKAGLRVYVDYYSGLDIFSQYYNLRNDAWGIGIAFDAW